MLLRTHIIPYLTGFAKTLQAQELKTISYLHVKATLMVYPRYLTMDGQVCFHRWLSCKTIESRECTTGLLLPLRGINETPWGTNGRLSLLCGLCYLCHILST